MPKIAKAHALDRVRARSAVYNLALDDVIEKRIGLAEVMDQAKLAGATQQEIADATAELEEERLSRQRVKQLIDDYREGTLR